MRMRITIETKPHGKVRCWPTEVTMIRESGTDTFATISGTEFQIQESMEELTKRLDDFQNY